MCLYSNVFTVNNNKACYLKKCPSLQLSYADTHPMYDHMKFPNLYRIVPSENQFNFARLELLRQFNWTHVATLYQNDPRYSLVSR